MWEPVDDNLVGTKPMARRTLRVPFGPLMDGKIIAGIGKEEYL
jgi:hypothetical protein